MTLSALKISNNSENQKVTDTSRDLFYARLQSSFHSQNRKIYLNAANLDKATKKDSYQDKMAQLDHLLSAILAPISKTFRSIYDKYFDYWERYNFDIEQMDCTQLQEHKERLQQAVNALANNAVLKHYLQEGGVAQFVQTLGLGGIGFVSGLAAYAVVSTVNSNNRSAEYSRLMNELKNTVDEIKNKQTTLSGRELSNQNDAKQNNINLQIASEFLDIRNEKSGLSRDLEDATKKIKALEEGQKNAKSFDWVGFGLGGATASITFAILKDAVGKGLLKPRSVVNAARNGLGSAVSDLNRTIQRLNGECGKNYVPVTSPLPDPARKNVSSPKNGDSSYRVPAGDNFNGLPSLFPLQQPSTLSISTGLSPEQLATQRTATTAASSSLWDYLPSSETALKAGGAAVGTAVVIALTTLSEGAINPANASVVLSPAMANISIEPLPDRMTVKYVDNSGVMPRIVTAKVRTSGALASAVFSNQKGASQERPGIPVYESIDDADKPTGQLFIISNFDDKALTYDELTLTKESNSVEKNQAITPINLDDGYDKTKAEQICTRLKPTHVIS